MADRVKCLFVYTAMSKHTDVCLRGPVMAISDSESVYSISVLIKKVLRDQTRDRPINIPTS